MNWIIAIELLALIGCLLLIGVRLGGIAGAIRGLGEAAGDDDDEE